MADRLFLGPLRGREPGLAAACSGYVANPMVQPMASKPALASIAALVRGDDPEAAWAADIGELRTFAEACDGERPWALVDAALDAGEPIDGDALDALEAWLRGGPVVRGARARGRGRRLARAGARRGPARAHRGQAAAGRPPDDGAAARITELSMALAATWPSVRRRPVSVMGPAVQLPAGDRPGRRRRVELPARAALDARPQRRSTAWSGAAARSLTARRDVEPAQGSRAARKKSRMCSRRVSSSSSVSGSRVEQALDERAGR